MKKELYGKSLVVILKTFNGIAEGLKINEVRVWLSSIE
jgi:hypothetical protein